MEGHQGNWWPFFVFTLLFLTSYAFGAEPSTEADAGCISQLRVDSGRVDRVTDGDTIVLDDSRRVRLIGINTPELDESEPSHQSAARSSKQALEDLLPHDEPVLLYVGQEAQDRHRRLLAHVVRQSDHQAVAETMLEQGKAFAIAVTPNTLCAAYFAKLETAARNDQLGVWKLDNLINVSAASINTKSRGFKLITGTVTQVERHSKNTRITLDNNLPVLVSNQIADQFEETYKPVNLMDKYIEVRGWLSRRKKQTNLRLQHRANLRLLTK